jgi:hypothetical protein
MSIRAAIVTAATLLLVPAVGLADPPRRAAKPAATVKRAQKKGKATKPARQQVQKMIFTDEEVMAGRNSGAGELINVRQPLTHSSLIKIRAHFMPELIKSADNV